MKVPFSKKNISGFLLKHSFLILLFSVLASLSGFVIKIVLSRSITVEEYGLFYAVISFVMAFSFFSDLNISHILQIIIPKLIKRKREGEVKSYLMTVVIWQFIIRTIIIIILISFSRMLAMHFFKNIGVMPVIILISLTFFLNSFGILSAGLICYHKYHIISFLNFFKVFSFLIAVLAYMLFISHALSISIVWLGILYLLSMVLTDILTIILFLGSGMPDFIRIKAKPSFDRFKIVFKKTIPLTLASLAMYFFVTVDVLLITYFRSATELGFYQMALPTAAIISSFILMPITLMTPSILSRASNKVRAAAITNTEKTILFITLPVIGIGLVAAPDILSLIFKQNGSLIIGFFRLLLLNQLIIIFFQTYFYVFIGLDKSKELLKYSIMISILLLVTALTATYLFGVFGTIMAYTISYMLFSILLRRRISRILKDVSFPISYFFKVLCAGAVSVGASLAVINIFTGFTRLVAIVCVQAVVYLIISLMLGNVDKELVKRFLNRKKS